MSNEMNEAGLPFREMVFLLHAAGMTYAEMEESCGGARSRAWFHTLVKHYDRWEVGPPGEDTIKPFARMFHAEEGEVREWIAEQWCQVVPNQETSARVRFLGRRIDELPLGDYELVRTLINRLAPDNE